MSDETTPGSRRSADWFERDDLDGFLHRSWLKTEGLTDSSFRGRPIIGICNSWSELVTCNAHLRQLAEHVKRGVLQAGGMPLEFPVMSPGEALMKPTTMLYRNLMAMDVEESIRGYPLDGVVLLAGCDKTVPGSLMGAASANIPTIMVTGGPMVNGRWKGEDLGSCTDCWRLYNEVRAGTISEGDWHNLEGAISRTPGHCMTMGTASTMACLTEALGMAMAGGAAAPAVHARRSQIAEMAGRQIIDLVNNDTRPRDILTAGAFENAIRVLHAISGSTNGILHLLALAGRVDVELSLDRFDELSEETPWIANIKPAGDKLLEDLYYAGGLPAVMREITDLLHLDERTVTGQTVGEAIAEAAPAEQPADGDHSVIASRSKPLSENGGLVVLKGNLCTDGAVLKRAAATPELLEHEGIAVVFENFQDMVDRIDDPDLPVDENSVLVLKQGGPVGGPGMPEWGSLPIPKKLLEVGVRDMVRISDARMSGTSYGTVILHVAPESAIGGTLVLVENGDRIRLSTSNRTLDLVVDDDELQKRRDAWSPPARTHTRGFGVLYQEHVMQANLGCDFDFLLGGSPVIGQSKTYG